MSKERVNFDSDINVSVFETNIRIVGGLLGAHLMAKRYHLLDSLIKTNSQIRSSQSLIHLSKGLRLEF